MRTVISAYCVFEHFRNMFPSNLIQACFQYTETYYKDKEDAIIPFHENTTSIMTTMSMENETSPEIVKLLRFKDGTNVLGKSIIVYKYHKY